MASLCDTRVLPLLPVNLQDFRKQGLGKTLPWCLANSKCPVEVEGFLSKSLRMDLPSFFINCAIHLPGYISEGQAEVKNLKVTVNLLIGFVQLPWKCGLSSPS